MISWGEFGTVRFREPCAEGRDARIGGRPHLRRPRRPPASPGRVSTDRFWSSNAPAHCRRSLKVRATPYGRTPARRRGGSHPWRNSARGGRRATIAGSRSEVRRSLSGEAQPACALAVVRQCWARLLAALRQRRGPAGDRKHMYVGAERNRGVSFRWSRPGAPCCRAGNEEARSPMTLACWELCRPAR
jgi:hypothetical protein